MITCTNTNKLVPKVRILILSLKVIIVVNSFKENNSQIFIRSRSHNFIPKKIVFPRARLKNLLVKVDLQNNLLEEKSNFVETEIFQNFRKT